MWEDLHRYKDQMLCFLPNLSKGNYILPTLYLSIENSPSELENNIYYPEKISSGIVPVYRSNINELYGRYFKVLEVVEKEQLIRSNFYLRLEDHSNGTIVYFQIPTTRSRYPFLVLGYYEKLKNSYVNKFHIAYNYSVLDDVLHERKITIHQETRWFCKNISISKIDSKLIYEIENMNGDVFGITQRDFDIVFNANLNQIKSTISDPVISELNSHIREEPNKHSNKSFGRRIIERNPLGVMRKIMESGFNPTKGKIVVDVTVNQNGEITSCTINKIETDVEIPSMILETLLVEFKSYRFESSTISDLEQSKITLRFSDL